MRHYKLDFTKNDIQKWLMEEVEFLRDNPDYSGSYYRLNNSSINEKLDLAAVVCWEPGFGEELRDDCIQASDERDFALCAGVKIYNPSDTPDSWDCPIDEDTNDLVCETVSLEESDVTDKFSHIADFIIRSYETCLAYDKEHNEKKDECLKESLDLSKVSTIKELIDLAQKEIKADGTYEISDEGELVEKDLTGYQASFFRPELTDSKFRHILDIIGTKLGKTYYGIFKGHSEISYNFPTQEEATEFANIFNQESIWDFSKGKEIKLNSNPEHVDYDKAIVELRRFLRNLNKKTKEQNSVYKSNKKSGEVVDTPKDETLTESVDKTKLSELTTYLEKLYVLSFPTSKVEGDMLTVYTSWVTTPRKAMNDYVSVSSKLEEYGKKHNIKFDSCYIERTEYRDNGKQQRFVVKFKMKDLDTTKVTESRETAIATRKSIDKAMRELFNDEHFYVTGFDNGNESTEGTIYIVDYKPSDEDFTDDYADYEEYLDDKVFEIESKFGDKLPEGCSIDAFVADCYEECEYPITIYIYCPDSVTDYYDESINRKKVNKSIKEGKTHRLISYSYADKLARRGFEKGVLETIIDELNDGAIDDPSYVREIVESGNIKDIEDLILNYYDSDIKFIKHNSK